nr:methylmalonyl Co-A mutase-associated GTPase MeaB [Parafrankia sp. EUN1f]
MTRAQGPPLATPDRAMLPGRRGGPALDVPSLVARARTWDPRAVGRLISMVENAGPELREVAAALAPHTGRAQVIGLTGPPGVGKSTTTTALVRSLRARDRRVGVLAVDPSSPFSGGALLGDRVRMQAHSGDRDVYIRSMATRGRLGGLAPATPQALRVLDAAGCDIVLVETVGGGQSELEIASLADTTLVLMAPGMGDGIQAAKAGILEVADIFVVNKADREGADQTVGDLRAMLSLGGRHAEPGAWRPPIIKTVASQEGDSGIDEVLDRLDEHRAWLASSGEGHRRRTDHVRREIEAIAIAGLRERLGNVHWSATLSSLAASVVAGETNPYRAADDLLGAL